MNPVIENYEALSAIMEKMRVAASQGLWNELISLEQQCSQRVQSMKEQDATMSLNESSRLQKAALIRKILADDAEIRNHTQPWMAQLQRIMGSASQERRLQQTYSSQF